MVDFVLGRLKFVYQGNWATSTGYIKDDIVTYGGRTYVCLSNHTSNSAASGGFYTDSANWNLIADGTQYKSTWTSSTYYKLNDVVQVDGNLWICTTQHTSASTFTLDESNWSIYVRGLMFENSYNSATQYYVGDIVTYGGYSYIANQDTLNNTPSTSPTQWSIFSTGLNFRGTWSSVTAYKVGDFITYGGYSYVAILDNTNQSPSPSSSYWKQVSSGSAFLGAYSGATNYKLGDIVTYGGYIYIANQDTLNNTPSTSPTQWSIFSTGLNFRGTWSSVTAYKVGDFITYGSYSYVAILDGTNHSPSPSSSYWKQISSGSAYQSSYSNTTSYKLGDIVSYGGSSYITNLDTVGVNPSNTVNWTIYTTGMNYKGSWSSGTTYQVNDVVSYSGTTYISTTYDNLANTPGVAGSWSIVAQGSLSGVTTSTGDMIYQSSGGSLTKLSIGANGQLLTTNSSGLPQWGNPGASANCYYVSPNGSDSSGFGSTIQKPFKTIKYAVSQVSGVSTIFVKTGTYTEQLPIVVPPDVSIVGEAMRTTIVQPNTGVLSDDAVNNNENSTMWKLSNGTLLTQMTFKGMTGFVPASSPNANDITLATLKGIVIAFNSASPITSKSPYVVYCSSICTGGIGALVDGSVHASGNKSMLFHSYTNIQDGGVGIYAKDNGKAEVVSCFTYFCHMGYAVSGGGKVRSLNGNHSYGVYGSVSRGYDTTEISSNGYVYGDMLTLNSNALNYSVGETITGGVSGATGTVTNVQASAGYVYYYRTSGATTFTTNETITGGSSGYIANTLSSNSVTGQANFVLVLSGLPQIPVAGQSIEFATTDANSYIIQTVSGSYVNSSSKITLVLTSQKTAPSANGTVTRIRQNFSNIRLTGHDFLNIGVGNTVTSNYPNVNTAATIQTNETVAINPGRVYYTSTDQDGNFRVGQYFAVNQATGAATLNASAFNLSGLTSLRLGSIGAQVGALISEFSTDGTLSANSDSKVPTQQAVKTYVDANKSAVINVALDPTYNSAQTTYDANGFITSYTDSILTVNNTVYTINSTAYALTSYKQTYLPTNTSYTYTITYYANGIINTITRV